MRANPPAAAPVNPLPDPSVPMPQCCRSSAQSRPAALLTPVQRRRPVGMESAEKTNSERAGRSLSCRAFLGRVLLCLFAALIGWTILSTFKSGPGSPQPPALSPPAAPRGVGQPAHYTFSRLSVVPDFIALSLAMGRIGLKVHRLPCVEGGQAKKITAALSDMKEPAELLAWWFRGKNLPGRPSASAEGYLAAEAFRAVEKACNAAAQDLHRPQALWWQGIKTHAGFAVDSAWARHFAEFEDSTWVFHPDEEDLGQYDDLDPVGNVNHHEAADVNRTAAGFLSRLHTTQLPELIRFCKRNGPPFQTPPEEFAILKVKFDTMVEQVEELSGPDWTEAARAGLAQLNIWDEPNPGLLRRAVFWVRGLPWEYPCRQTPISWDSEMDSSERDDADSWRDPSPASLRSAWDHADPYYYASAFRCVLASQRVIREQVLPLVRESQTGLAEAQAQYEKQVAEASQRLKRQVGELVSGRGWEFVERVQIGVTAGGHWLEVSRAEAKAIPVTDVRNTTIWRRMFLPLDVRTADQLKAARLKLRGY